MELRPGTAYFQVDPEAAHLKREMLDYAEEHLSIPAGDGRELTVYINDRDPVFQTIAGDADYQVLLESEPMSSLALPGQLTSPSLPHGFSVRSSSQSDDSRRIHRLLYRGFNHGAEPPDDGVAHRKLMQSAPNYETDLNVVVQARGGDLASYCGIWYEPTNNVAYVEPMVTDPDYRGMGLARAALFESINRCAARGARVVYVGSDLPVYISAGFRTVFNCSAWKRRLD
jgi:GNAT superfamily N-acetyltransferase